jgi:hypothetical protein
MPPPSTRFNSAMRSGRRGMSSAASALSGTGLPPATGSATSERPLSGARTITSSSVFHSPHSGHLPDQSNITFLRESHST